MIDLKRVHMLEKSNDYCDFSALRYTISVFLSGLYLNYYCITGG
jgi:hypothetical protein